ncbi:hypothetical protein FOC1_g10016414 [Fusarium oxysporum f. sp. cubense race 1]|uniref:Uncharacterized protein n=1 Tax=Fusarium oxysporum f. sp. cubense (strain race 1) TaxID=1229664 RepID=N4TE95_FUSC1|nr:hypothetical protein FOC1_g10016414 [Fusarium oxysporum f. sp. cubense race 1]
MARSISSLRSQKDGGSRSSSTSSDSKVSSTCDRESDTSSVNSNSSELQDTSSTYSGNSTDSNTVQVDFDHRGETSPLQPPFSPRMVSEHQSRPYSLGRSPPMDVKRRRSSADSIRAVWGSPERHSEGFPGFQSSRQSDETAETHSSSCTHASGPNTAQSSTRPPSSVVTEAHGDATTTTGARPFYILVLIPTCCSDRRERTQ